MKSRDDYSRYTKQDLIVEITKLKTRKKYGLVWDEEKTKEIFEKKTENKLPMLKECGSKYISGGGGVKNQPTS